MDDHTIRAIELLAGTRQRDVELQRLGTKQTAGELDEAAEVLADLAIVKTTISDTDLIRTYRHADSDVRKLEADALLAVIVRPALGI